MPELEGMEGPSRPEPNPAFPLPGPTQLAEDVGTGWDVAALNDAAWDYKGSCGCVPCWPHFAAPCDVAAMRGSPTHPR